MTQEEIDFLTKMEIYSIGSKLYPNRFFVPYIGDVDISKLSYFPTLLNRIHNKGYEEGVERGMEIKIEQIKEVLNLT